MSQGFGNGAWGVGRYGQWSYVDAAVAMPGASTVTVSAIKSQGTAVVMSAASSVTIFAGQVHLSDVEINAASGTWGTKTNTTISNLATALASKSKNIGSDANATFTMPDGTADDIRAFHLKITSATLTATRTVTIAPNTVNKVWIIDNATTGSQSQQQSPMPRSPTELSREPRLIFLARATFDCRIQRAVSTLRFKRQRL